jgi:hypothetical protein
MADDDIKVSDLVRGAFVAGHISRQSVGVLKRRNVAGALPEGLRRHNLKGAEILLVTAVVDDSGSIAEAHQELAIREGHNRLLQVLKDARSSAHVLVTTRLLNGKIINPFCMLRDAGDLTTQNYDPAQFGGTPLYHQSVVTLGTLMLQTQALEEVGCRVRTITLLMTDGLDESHYVTGHNHFQVKYGTPASDVAFIAKDMHRSGNHLLAAYAVGAGAAVLEGEFTKMGIRPGWVLTSPDTLKSLMTFASAAVRASVSHASFQKLLAQGRFDSDRVL